MGHPPRIPVWLAWEQSVVYFVTICTANRRAVLANQETFRAFKLIVSNLRDWHVLAAIIMPDHLHIIVAPIKNREAKLGNFSAALKRWMREQLGASWQWQAGCFDRLLRTNESLHDKWLYIREDPVRAGLVQKWENRSYRYEFNEEIGKRRACPTILHRVDSVSGMRFPQ
jgi:REP-associated tyrosine transposase